MSNGPTIGTKRQAPRHGRMARHGVSLVEMMVSIAAVAIALSLVAGVTYRGLQMDRTAREQAETDEATRAFSWQLRADVHAARDAELLAEGSLRLTRFDEVQVEYRWDGAVTERIERQGDAVLRRERFRRSATQRLAGNVEQRDGGARWVVVTCEETTRTGQVQRRWRCEAALGTERRERRSARRSGRHVTRRSRGFLLAAALACLFVLSLLGAAVAQRLLVAKRQSRLNHQRAQATLLADAGCRRAIARLKRDAAYGGEVWIVPAGTLGATTERSDGAEVELRVQSVEGEPRRRVVNVVARYPVDPVQGVVQRRQFEIEL